MRRAMACATRAEATGEVPVGAVLVADEQLISEGCNQLINTHDASAHAEIMTLRAAGETLKNYRLPGTTLYVTLEPCTMCAGAMLHARVSRLVFGAYDPKTGAAGSMFDTLNDDRHFHHIEVTGGVLEKECAEQLQAFFRTRRKAGKSKHWKQWQVPHHK